MPVGTVPRRVSVVIKNRHPRRRMNSRVRPIGSGRDVFCCASKNSNIIMGSASINKVHLFTYSARPSERSIGRNLSLSSWCPWGACHGPLLRPLDAGRGLTSSPAPITVGSLQVYPLLPSPPTNCDHCPSSKSWKAMTLMIHGTKRVRPQRMVLITTVLVSYLHLLRFKGKM